VTIDGLSRHGGVELDIAVTPLADVPTVTPEGDRLAPRIEGVLLRAATVHSDERGSLTEILNPAWRFTEEPIVYVYQATIRPGQKKGWVVHREQDDRLFFDDGTAKVVLYDARAASPTKGMINELFLGSANWALLRVPAGVFHAVVNVGASERGRRAARTSIRAEPTDAGRTRCWTRVSRAGRMCGAVHRQERHEHRPRPRTAAPRAAGSDHRRQPARRRPPPRRP
jgi:dTDP-4-dehydrorhamnose 3,5-epimerase